MTAARPPRGIWKDGSGRDRHTTKGRQLDAIALDQVRELLAVESR